MAGIWGTSTAAPNGDAPKIDRCLTFLAAQTLPKGQFEVIVADNNSHCGIDEVRRVCGDFVRVVPPQFRGRDPRAT